MSQLATIFEKIKEDFFINLNLEEKKEQYKLIFAPFSMGFTNDDFLFLDTNSASEQATKYYDELYEFSQIANTIPSSENFWVTSNNQNDYLFNKYKTIIQSLRLIDLETLTVEMLRKHPIFEEALNAINSEIKNEYKSYYLLQKEIKNDIKNLKRLKNNSTTQLQINLKNENLSTIEKEWVSKGNKEQVENKILEIVKDEIKRFITKLSETKAVFESTIRNHPTSQSSFNITHCKPNNLYRSNELSWKKIKLDRQEINRLLKKGEIKNYKTIFGDSKSDIDINSVEFELLFVDITRAWFDNSILKSPFWDINIINQEEINIENITDKLVFVRKINLIPNKNSPKNKAFKNSGTVKNLGPFVINPNLLKTGKKIQLQSINSGLQIDRKAILNVASTINKKQKSVLINRSSKNIISKKQLQFTKLAPRLQRKQNASLLKFTTTELLKSINLKGLLTTINYELKFIDFENKHVINIAPSQITLFRNNKKIPYPFKKLNNSNLSVQLQPQSDYNLVVKTLNYEIKHYNFKTLTFDQAKKHPIKLTITLKKEEITQSVDNSFQLIGVVAKKISSLPKPIKNADYI